MVEGAVAAKTNASTVHAALQLPDDIPAIDLGAAIRSGVSALMAAARSDGVRLRGLMGYEGHATSEPDPVRRRALTARR